MLTLGSLRPVAGFLVGQVMVGGFAALFIFGNSPFWFGLGYALLGGFRLCRTMVLAFARPLVHPEETGLAYGILETTNSVAIIIAPVIAGLLYDHSPLLVYRVALVAVMASIVISGITLPRLQRKSLELKIPEEVPVSDD